jgi:pimeloyl-ACP methyl ester carboxylesterase
LNNDLQLGHGPHKVLVLNGWFGSSDDWSAMVNALDLDAFTFVFFNYRGYGRSMQLDGEFTFDEVARDVTQLVERLGWERFSLIGHSMGGMAMQRVLLAMPRRVERMIAITAVPACGARMDEQRLAMFQKAIQDLETRKAILNASTGNRLTKTWIEHMGQRSWATSIQKAFGSYLKEWTAQDFSELVKGNATPLKVIVGEHDPSLTAAAMERTWLAWYPNAVLETLPNAGHYPMHEVPLALAASIQAFLQQS